VVNDYKNGHRKISGGEWEIVEKNVFGVNVFKKVIGNLAYREMLFYKKALVLKELIN